MSFIPIPAVSQGMNLYTVVSSPKSNCSIGMSDTKEKTLSTADKILKNSEPKR